MNTENKPKNINAFPNPELAISERFDRTDM